MGSLPVEIDRRKIDTPIATAETLVQAGLKAGRLDRLITALRSRWLVVGGAPATALAVAGVLTALQTPAYEATSTARLVTRASDLTTGIGVDAIAYEDRLANTYRQILETRRIRDWLAGRLGVSSAPSIEVELPANSQLVRITARDSDADRAAKAANLLAERLAGDIAVPGTVTLVESARTPGSPASPSWPLNLLIAALAGLVAGTALALALERRDPTLRGARAIEEASGIPVIGEIPPGTAPSAIVNSGSPQEEAFRGLRVTIAADARLGQLRTILVTGLERGPMTSMVVANLATAFADAGRCVVAIDADLREPALHGVFGLSNTTGLGQRLMDGKALGRSLRQSHRVSVLTAGRSARAPGLLLSSPRMLEILSGLAEDHDLVLLSSHSLLAAADARILAAAVDGVVLVAPRGSAHEEALRRALHQLEMVGRSPIGMVLA